MKENKKSKMHIDQFQLDLMIEQGSAYIENYSSQIVNFYAVDRIRSVVHKLYGESRPSDKLFLPIVELNVLITIGNTIQSYRKGTSVNNYDFEATKIFVFEKELESKNVEIEIGDFFTYFDGKVERYFEVMDSGIVNTSTIDTFGGYKTYKRTIVCKQVKENVFLPYKS